MYSAKISKRFDQSKAFTLIELIVVIVIVGLLIALSMPFMMKTMEANRLTAAGETLMFKLSMAQQLSAAENKVIECRLYKYSESDEVGFWAYQLYDMNPAGGDDKPIDTAVMLANDNIKIIDGSLSPLLQAGAYGSGWPKTAPSTDTLFKSKSATYLSIIFYPDGSTNLPMALSDAYFTLSSSGTTGTETPANYYTIQVDPITGRVKSYRPS